MESSVDPTIGSTRTTTTTTTKTTAADAAADIHEAGGQARALYRYCDEPSTGAGQVANASKPESSSLTSRCSGWSADRGTMQHFGPSCLIGELLAGVGAVCPRHLEDVEEVKAVTSGGSGGGGGAGAEFLVRVFKVFSLDRVQQRFVDQILGFVDVLVILQAVFQQSKVFFWMVPQIQFTYRVLQPPVCGGDVYPQCKLCGRPLRSRRCCSWLTCCERAATSSSSPGCANCHENCRVSAGAVLGQGS